MRSILASIVGLTLLASPLMASAQTNSTPMAAQKTTKSLNGKKVAAHRSHKAAKTTKAAQGKKSTVKRSHKSAKKGSGRHLHHHKTARAASLKK